MHCTEVPTREEALDNETRKICNLLMIHFESDIQNDGINPGEAYQFYFSGNHYYSWHGLGTRDIKERAARRFAKELAEQGWEDVRYTVTGWHVSVWVRRPL